MIAGIRAALAETIPQEVLEALADTPGEARRAWQQYQDRLAEDRLLADGA